VGTNVIDITTSSPHKLAAGNSAYLEFTATATSPGSANYTVLAAPVPTATTFSVNQGGGVNTTYNQAAGSKVVTINTAGPGLGAQIYLFFASGGPVSAIYTVASVPDTGRA
jgi:hypothetical protein